MKPPSAEFEHNPPGKGLLAQYPVRKELLVTIALALFVALTATQTWARSLFITIDGTDTDRGMITLVAALVVAALAGWRFLFDVTEGLYYIGSLAMALLALSMSTWMLVDILNEPASEFFGSEVRIIDAGWALYVAVFASGGLSALLGIEAVQGVANFVLAGRSDGEEAKGRRLISDWRDGALLLFVGICFITATALISVLVVALR